MPNELRRLSAILLVLAGSTAVYGADDYPIQEVSLASVRLAPGFWSARIETNRTVTIPHNLQELESHGSLGAFAILAGRSSEKYRGYIWADSDVYKTLEGIAYSLRNHADPALEQRMEQIVANIVGAQADDGYLMPHIQIAEPKYVHFKEETSRTSELYDMGHMIESAVAHHQATGRRNYLEAAIKLANLVVRAYGPGGIDKPSGCPEIELALVRLYHATGNRAYLNLAATLTERARRSATTWSGGKPALAHDEAIGHAVAMLYLYSAATDVAALTGDEALMALVRRKWENAVGRKMYITGNAGVRTHGEDFGLDYELPNGAAYCETCAAVAMIFWNQRMFLAHGDAKYVDVLERALYNGFLVGISLRGDRFFYPNPLQWDGKQPFNCGQTERFRWTGCACCPTNIVRFVPRIPGYVYATRDNALYVNLFMPGTAQLKMNGQSIKVRQETDYPWEGRIKLTITPDGPARFPLNLRIPGWARNEPVPGDLYRYADTEKPELKLAINGQAVGIALEKGYAVVERPWKPGDVVTLDLSMPVRRVAAHASVKDDAGKIAVERGPVVYCAEGVDNGGKVLGRALPNDVRLVPERKPDLLGGVTIVRSASADVPLTLVPYYSWAHRGPGEMAVWLPAGLKYARRDLNPQPSVPKTDALSN